MLPAKVSWGSEMSSTRVTSFMMISPSSAFKTLKWLIFVPSFSPCAGAFPFSGCGPLAQDLRIPFSFLFSLVANLLLEFFQGFPVLI